MAKQLNWLQVEKTVRRSGLAIFSPQDLRHLLRGSDVALRFLLTRAPQRGEVVKLPPAVRDSWWEGTTRQWPFMAADMGIGRDTLMAHYLSNHVAVAYGDVFEEMVALSEELGFAVRVLSAAR